MICRIEDTWKRGAGDRGERETDSAEIDTKRGNFLHSLKEDTLRAPACPSLARTDSGDAKRSRTRDEGGRMGELTLDADGLSKGTRYLPRYLRETVVNKDRKYQKARGLWRLPLG